MGFRGMSPKQMARMMKKMGIEQKDLEGVKEVIIRFADKEWVISNPQVTAIKQSGAETYQVGGSKTERAISGAASPPSDSDVQEEVLAPEIEIPMEDAALVAGQTGVDIETAKQALKETEGDLAAAILKLRR
ncbi:MAG: nascent polypeptide-associated complex protein [Candidatus Thorarchaeota archaeon]|jgi:nascent polypeptide-associated complex subunit alpha|nr:nascent polypeptide-associated complex protein [Candidatus Thorarchaeota archaeon]